MSGFYRKRGKSYQVIYDEGRDENGKRIRKFTSFHTEKEAIVALEQFNNRVKLEKLFNPETITFGEFLNYWFDNYVKNKCEINTQIGYKNNIEKYIKPYLGNIQLNKLMSFQIQLYYQWLINDKGLSPNTIYRHHANIRKALDYGVKQQFLTHNVADAVQLPKKQEYIGGFYTVEQLLQLQVLLKGHELEIPVNLAIYLGLRREEIAGLKWRYVDLIDRKIEIREVRVRAQKETITKKPKTKGSLRSLFISDDLLILLLRHKQQQEKQKKKIGKEMEVDDYVYAMPSGEPYRPERISLLFSNFLKANNLPHIRLHDLRHTFASVLYQNGMSVKSISEALGHSDITTTLKIYTHMFDETIKDTIIKMDDLLKKKDKD